MMAYAALCLIIAVLAVGVVVLSVSLYTATKTVNGLLRMLPYYRDRVNDGGKTRIISPYKTEGGDK